MKALLTKKRICYTFLYQIPKEYDPNSGTLNADGGVVAMTAATARVAVNSVINNTGVIEARSVGIQNGRIILGGSTAVVKAPDTPIQTVRVFGTLNATGIDELFPVSESLTGGYRLLK
ncbi:MAG: hypothetical protein L3J37_11630 [Rhodobacteraceae bacterium]|nr:hypothetical protein [Paracoccaceae bacterium]